MKFYHVSQDIHHDGVFTPRIPSRDSRMDGEDIENERICVSRTLAGCFSAFPGGGSRLDELNEKQRGYYKVFEIDTEKLGIADEHILSSEMLFESGKVEDACFTDECWIMIPFTISSDDCYMIYLSDWEEEPKDLIPHDIMLIADKEYDGDYSAAYMDIKGDFPSTVNIVTNLSYKKGSFSQGESFEHNYLDYFELEIVNELLSKQGIQLEEDDFCFKVSGNANTSLLIQELAVAHHASIFE